jgi:hypothetical protein
VFARVKASFGRLADFSYLAHELRTPISNLSTQTQVAISKAWSAGQYREVLYIEPVGGRTAGGMIADCFSGLGLAITKSTVEAHKGTIRIFSSQQTWEGSNK